jgi:hypothetical protein
LAHQEVNEALGPGTLEDEFKVLEGSGDSGDVEDRLLALKQEMGLIAPPEGEAPQQLESGDDDVEVEGTAEGAEAEGADGDATEAATPPAPEEPVVHEAQLIEEFDKLEQGE